MVITPCSRPAGSAGPRGAGPGAARRWIPARRSGCGRGVKPAPGNAAPARQTAPVCPRYLLECGTEMDRQLPAYHLVRSPGRGGEAPLLVTAQQAGDDLGGGQSLGLIGPS